ncbi:MAG: hypothetical protein CSA66_02735 [Proteobacteria bacterium]|nr:MAG: hypothetical protein CSA66_02735 [Pseudomonadota bacterium]
MILCVTYARAPIVIVDDEPQLAKMLEHLANRAAVPARIFTDADQALRFIRAHPVAAIVADQLMPAMTGSELLERVPRRSRPT